MGITFQRYVIYQGRPSERVLLVVGDVTGNGRPDVVTAGRVGSEGLWLLTAGDDPTRPWSAHLMDDAYERLEAGGFLYDIDGDGRLDFIGGGDWKGRELCWWRQPDDATQRWQRRVIIEMPAGQSHDQCVTDLDGDGRPELYFWNQGGEGHLFVVPVPDDPTVSPWPNVQVLLRGVKEEGFGVADIDGDGRPELIAGQHWFKPDGRGGYARFTYAEGFVSPRVAAGDFDGDGQLEIALAEGDASFKAKTFGRVAILKHDGNPTRPWKPTLLHDQLEDPHTLIAADFDGDGRTDLLVGELGDPNGRHKHPPTLRLYQQRDGQLVEHIIDDSGIGTHEGKLAVIDGTAGVVGKPYRNLAAAGPRSAACDQVHLWLSVGRAVQTSA